MSGSWSSFPATHSKLSIISPFFFYYDVSPFLFITAPEKWNLRFKVILVNTKKAKNIKIKRQQHIGWRGGGGERGHRQSITERSQKSRRCEGPPARDEASKKHVTTPVSVISTCNLVTSDMRLWSADSDVRGGGGHLNFVIESSWAMKINISECQIAKRTIQCPYKSRSGWT